MAKGGRGNSATPKLAPIYVVSGEELLQVEESLDRIRAAARAQGFSERQVLDVDTGFDWSQLALCRNSLSLFAEQRLIDLRVPNGKPGDAGSKALIEYGDAPPDENTLLLVSAGDLDARARRSKWYKSLEANGVVVHAWAIDSAHLPSWIKQRARGRNFQITDDAAAELAVRVEGNLLAGAQELELLGMLGNGQPIDVAAIESVAANSARFDTFDLVDATLEGDAARTVRILRGLESEGTVPTLIIGTLAWQLRSLAQFSAAVQEGHSLGQILRGNPVWNRRRSVLERALKRHPLRYWHEALAELRHIDAMSKGARVGNPWGALLRLCVGVSGLALLESSGV